MPQAKSASAILALAAITTTSILACINPYAAKAQAAKAGSVELKESLYILDPHAKDINGLEIPGVLLVVSIPQPIEKYCMGKTSDQCATIDFCIRTTTKSVAMCQNLPPSLKHLPPYPAGMRPNRQFSISFRQGAPNIPGFDALRQFYDSAPKGSLDVFSPQARFQAKIRFTQTATDGQFELLAVLSVPSL